MGRSGTYRATALGASLAVLGAGPAFAQDQPSNVSMYGIADGGVEIVNRGTGASTAVRIDSGIAATSRLGIKGSEDLGGGLSAFFTFEGQVNVDAGSGAAAGGGYDFARRSFTGIGGSWGQVYLGRDYTPGYLMIRENDIFGYGLNGTLLQFSTAGGVTARASNGIFYYAPVFGGLQIQAMYASGEFDTDPKERGNIAGIGFLYNSGPFSANAHYQTINNTANPVIKAKEYGLGGGWVGNGFRVKIGYGASDPDGANNTVSYMNLGAGMVLGSGELLAQVISMKREVATGTEPKATTFGVAYVYPMSKRTNLYTTFGTTRNNTAGTFTLNNGANNYAPPAAGGDPKALGFGIRHVF